MMALKTNTSYEDIYPQLTPEPYDYSRAEKTVFNLAAATVILLALPLNIGIV